VRSAQAIDPEHSPVPDQPAASNSMTPAMLVAAIGAGVVVAALVAWYILSR
jgi:hypothetical protein